MAVGAQGAAPAGTYIETAAIGVKEDLADIIRRIDPDETPLYTEAQVVEASQVLHEWLVQELNSAGDNAQLEGFTAVMQTVVKPVRLNNVCQIAARTVAVSGTLRSVDMAGGEDEFNRQVILRGMEVKRDVELAFTSPLVRAITDPRHMSGLPCYCVNGSRGAGAGVMPVGDGSNNGTAGTLRDLTLAMVDAATQQCWQAGGKPTLGIMSGNVKAYFATLSQGGTGNAVVAQNIQNVTAPESVTIIGAVDVYRSNFGTIQLAPDRFCPAHQILLITPDYVEASPLPGRNLVQQNYAVTGDNSQGGIIFEGCVTPTAPKAHAWISDLNQ
ncbi:MAG TPA: DUF5309 family protein [Steroidobacteraceae bacterium]